MEFVELIQHRLELAQTPNQPSKPNKLSQLNKPARETKMTIQPEGEDLRKAITWISEQRLDDPNQPLSALVEAAALRFNLSPKDEIFLSKWLQEKSE